MAAELARALGTRRGCYRQANFDALTGLANRSLFFDRLNQALLHARRHGLTAALLFVDLNHFKERERRTTAIWRATSS